MRLWNPEYTNVTEKKELFKPDIHGRTTEPYIEIFFSGTSNANATEIGAAADSAKDGTTTPFKVNVVSSSADDTDAADKDVRKVRLIGISVPVYKGVTVTATAGIVDPDWANGKEAYTVEELNMNGTTDVYSQRFWIHCMGFYSSDWGSAGQDALGTIEIESPANVTLLTIAAGANESNGGIIYGCYGHAGRLTYLKAGPDDVAFDNS